MSRRKLLAGAAAAGAALLPGAAFAQSALSDLLAAPTRGNWDDQFDTRGSSGGTAKVSSNQPVFSPNTITSMQQAMGNYQQIVGMGGWPQVPEVGKLQLGVQNAAVSTLRQRLMVSGDLSQSAGLSPAFDSYVDAATKRFQTRHGLPDDGVISTYTYKALNVPADIRLGQLQTNIVRLQSMSGFLGERFVMVNVPAAAIEAVEGGRVVQRHTAVVGKIDRQTPILNSKITNLNLNPYWHAPESIVRKDIIPLMQKDPTYLTKNDIKIFAPDGTEIPPQSINWNTDEAARYLFRQEPGKNNAMSSVKINFPNTHATYMHDTPQQSLFSKLMRFESSGCVRVQNVRDLVVWLARDEPGWDRQSIERVIATRKRQDINLKNPVPVYFTYISAWATDPNVVQFRDDIYHRDGAEQLAMNDLQAVAYSGNEQVLTQAADQAY
ncbi:MULTISPECIES: L,D-transpeptidase family protein [unclassified Aureimonas]|uniref:L,D-transpeptidase family protein n=1 Tax=unclassified Aureimonas TaxID=2615206 RepID=UPI0006F48721|nr:MULTISPECIES: L,D-transpeptidase family protein [unclassified Aureimonas]KQT53087.1 amidase [Aureimonas sp. Leaf427]KQT80545.1 amidase [Aureimonas sp. Leaf460]